jgi:hypothetical protein
MKITRSRERAGIMAIYFEIIVQHRPSQSRAFLTLLFPKAEYISFISYSKAESTRRSMVTAYVIMLALSLLGD